MRSYYSFSDTVHSGLSCCSRASDEYPLTVNCAGGLTTSFPFTTHNQQGREDFYLLYMVKGSMTVYLSDGAHTAEAGTAVLYPPRYPYRYLYGGAAPLSYFWVHFTGSYAERLLRECGFSPLPCLALPRVQNRVAEQFRRLLERTEGTETLREQELACELERLLLTLARFSRKEEPVRPLSRSIGIIHASYHKELRIPELARAENLSHSRYITLFRRQTGLSPTAYIVDLRLKSACELLRNTDMTIKQIGLQVGYDDPFFFSKLFKRHIGVSPTEYRKALS